MDYEEIKYEKFKYLLNEMGLYHILTSKTIVILINDKVIVRWGIPGRMSYRYIINAVRRMIKKGIDP